VTRALRAILLALLFALVAGFVAGTLLRHRLERPAQYLGDAGASGSGAPLHVG
jgi:hypothetical protein